MSFRTYTGFSSTDDVGDDVAEPVAARFSTIELAKAYHLGDHGVILRDLM